MSSCHRPTRRVRRGNPLDPGPRFPVRDPIEAVQAVRSVLGHDAPAGTALLLVETDGMASRLLVRDPNRVPSPAAENEALDAAISVILEAVGDWRLGAVVGVMIRDRSDLALSASEADRWAGVARQLERGGVPLLDVLVVTPTEWSSVRWIDGPAPGYEY